MISKLPSASSTEAEQIAKIAELQRASESLRDELKVEQQVRATSFNICGNANF